MPLLAILFGAALVALGLTAYYSPDSLAGGNPKQPSALSPAFVGVVLLTAGVMSLLAPSKRKHAMHGAASAGLLGVIGGFVPMFLRKFDFATTAVQVGAGMTVLSAVFLALCVNSFIQARRRREAAGAV